MLSNINSSAKELVGMVSKIPEKKEDPFICSSCNNTGRLETLQYLGETIPGFMRNGEIVIGYNKWFAIFMLYYRKINPKIIDGMSDINFAEQLAVAKKHHGPIDTQYKILNIVACTKCKSAEYKGIR
jgi:hypothetical protein